jgi:hypothetical protein
MPTDVVPIIVAIVAMFATFMVVLGGAAFWTNQPERRQKP